MTTALKRAEYYEFVRFIATPRPLRELKTQLEFQLQYNVGHSTLAVWKKDRNFWEDVKREIKEWAKEKTPDVVFAVYAKAASGGDVGAARLWLEYVEEMKTKTEETKKLELGENLLEVIKNQWLEKNKPKVIEAKTNGNIEQ